MSGFIQGEARRQTTLFPEALDDYITEKIPSVLLMPLSMVLIF